MHFIPASRLVLERLEVNAPELGALLQACAQRIVDRVPSCVAVSAVLGPAALTLMLLADSGAGIPPPAPMHTKPTSGDALDELAWQRQRAEDPDVRCAASLELPFRTGCVRLIWPHRDGLIWPHLTTRRLWGVGVTA
ncbi:hypothetical protein [Cellulomonas sp. NS3]|uniref:hypothetical protein n=1 Tax=Cellulomonas sp. NS3 TaxID=2973977 RepID=UPI00216116C6|nr:hypothetical protein [Cellulomonas sp. NS3]